MYTYAFSGPGIQRSAATLQQESSQRPTVDPRAGSRHSIERSLGNQGVQRLASLAASGGVPMTSPGDRTEREAERAADAVMRGEHAGLNGSRAGAQGGIGGGAPLDSATRSEMENHFGRDFSDVRVHTGPDAAQSAERLNARAFTSGADVVFGEGAYRPDTPQGRRTLAHELAHVAQGNPGVAREEKGPPPQQQPQPKPTQTGAGAAAQPAVKTGPSTTEKVAALSDKNIMTRTIGHMRRMIARDAAAATRNIAFKPSFVAEADKAIRKYFAGLVRTDRTFETAHKKPGTDVSVKTVSRDDIAGTRISGTSDAEERIGEVAMRQDPELMDELGITDATDAALKTAVAAPILKQESVDFVRNYEKSTIGGDTAFDHGDQLKSGVSVRIPKEHPYLGTIIVHEAMHFYVSDEFRVAARKRSDHTALMEGGAEFLARQVLYNELAGKPGFEVQHATYQQYVGYIVDRGAGFMVSFPLMYFAGRTDILDSHPAA